MKYYFSMQKKKKIINIHVAEKRGLLLKHILNKLPRMKVRLNWIWYTFEDVSVGLWACACLPVCLPSTQKLQFMLTSPTDILIERVIKSPPCLGQSILWRTEVGHLVVCLGEKSFFLVTPVMVKTLAILHLDLIWREGWVLVRWRIWWQDFFHSLVWFGLK